MRGDAPPYARPILYQAPEEEKAAASGDRLPKALDLIAQATDNHRWRQEMCINLIPSEMTPSPGACGCSPPATRPSAMQSTKKVKSFLRRGHLLLPGHRVHRPGGAAAPRRCAPTLLREAETRVNPAARCPTWRCSPPSWTSRTGSTQADSPASGLRAQQPHHQGRTPQRPAHGRPPRLIAVDPVTERSAVVNFPRLQG